MHGCEAEADTWARGARQASPASLLCRRELATDEGCVSFREAASAGRRQDAFYKKNVAGRPNAEHREGRPNTAPAEAVEPCVAGARRRERFARQPSRCSPTGWDAPPLTARRSAGTCLTLGCLSARSLTSVAPQTGQSAAWKARRRRAMNVKTLRDRRREDKGGQGKRGNAGAMAGSAHKRG
ncbi:hypothetical protein ERJ75_000539900 [Trypanosoma vivax]|nr:hypothetical protein ERJ75_000539900 [Trypanosoma vivax]